jgi:hypothetical protein
MESEPGPPDRPGSGGDSPERGPSAATGRGEPAPPAYLPPVGGAPPAPHGPPPGPHGAPPGPYGPPPGPYGPPPGPYGAPSPYGPPGPYGGYPSPYGYYPTSYAREPENTQAIIGFCLSVGSLSLLVLSAGFLAPISFGLAIAGFFVGRSGRGRVQRGETSRNEGLAKAAVIIGIVGVAVSVLATLAWVLVFVSAGNG